TRRTDRGGRPGLGGARRGPVGDTGGGPGVPEGPAGPVQAPPRGRDRRRAATSPDRQGAPADAPRPVMLPVASGGHGWGLAIFPLLAGFIALAFGVVLAGRNRRRRRPHELAWVAALLMYAVASLAMFAGVL